MQIQQNIYIYSNTPHRIIQPSRNKEPRGRRKEEGERRLQPLKVNISCFHLAEFNQWSEIYQKFQTSTK